MHCLTNIHSLSLVTILFIYPEDQPIDLLTREPEPSASLIDIFIMPRHLLTKDPEMSTTNRYLQTKNIFDFVGHLAYQLPYLKFASVGFEYGQQERSYWEFIGRSQTGTDVRVLDEEEGRYFLRTTPFDV